MSNKIAPLHIIIERVGFSDASKGAYFFADEIEIWPKEVLECLLEAKLLHPASRYRDLITCDGCEYACIMPVTIYPAQPPKPGQAFVMCDKRDDAGRVPVDFKNLKQWHSSIDNFASVLPSLLKTLLPPDNPISENGKWPLGYYKSNKGHVPLYLTIMQKGGLILLIGDQPIPLKEVISLNKKGLSVNNALLKSAVDETSETETPDERAMRIGQQRDLMKSQGKKKIRTLLAQQENVSESMIQKIFTRYDTLKKTKPVSNIFALGDKKSR